MSNRKTAVAIAILALIACIRVASTYRVFSPIIDEPNHLAAGFEFLTERYTIDVSHPPLARALCALPLKLAGYPMPKRDPNEVVMGYELLYHGDRIEKTLARARMPNLLFLLVAIFATADLARRAFGNVVAIVTTLIFTNVPAVLAHAGLITTDMAGAAALATAILAADVYLTAPTRKRAVFLGLAVAFGVLTKMSFFVFFPACFVVLFALRRPRIVWRDSAIVAFVAFFGIWAGYKFDVARPKDLAPLAPIVFERVAPAPLKHFAVWFAENAVIPAPALPVGIASLKHHDMSGHTAFLLGQVRDYGWWYYFPVVFFYKTPIPLMLLALWGMRRRTTLPFTLLALAIMLVAMTGSINIGVRHILAVYTPLSIVAARALVEIWNRRDSFARATGLALAAWLIIGVAVEHPDYLAWFNEFGNRNPGAIAVDSNLDWGQDMFRLERFMRAHQIWAVHLVYLSGVHFNSLPVETRNVTHGWVAIGETPLALMRPYGDYRWLDIYRPQTRIGKSMRLYWIP